MIAWHLCFECQGLGDGGLFLILPPTPTTPTPENLSHIYDTPDILCLSVWGGVVGGGLFSHWTPHHPPPPPLKFKSYLWYPDIYVWVSGGGVVGGSYKKGKN